MAGRGFVGLCIAAFVTCATVVYGNEQHQNGKYKMGKSKKTNFHQVLQLKTNVTAEREAQQKLLKIYRDQIRPLAEAYRFADLNRDTISEGEIFAKPLILFLGPWSSGKSTMINYLLSVEDSNTRLRTGAEPTTSDFTVITHGPAYRIVQGIQLVSDNTKHYTPLQKFGLSFLERFQGVELPHHLLDHLILVDTPGIIENKKQQARGYPFNDVCQWFIDRAHLIFLLFDPTKLDIGSELETLFTQLKGHEAKLRLIMNKADTVNAQELMRVYGALFWSLAPLVNEVEPPRVYVGSMWSEPYRPGTMHSLFLAEEQALMDDLSQVVRYHLERKVAATRRHAFLVRLHALTVNSYLQTFSGKTGLFFFGDSEQLWKDMVEHPKRFSILNQLRQYPDVSHYDLPTAETYQRFFSVNNNDKFGVLSSHCSMWSGCAMNHLLKAINTDLPQLLQQLKQQREASGHCTADTCGR